MNAERIKEIQKETAYPESLSVQQALCTVWNECAQEYKKQLSEYKEALKEEIPSGKDLSDKFTYTMKKEGWKKGLDVVDAKKYEAARWMREQVLKAIDKTEEG